MIYQLLTNSTALSYQQSQHHHHQQQQHQPQHQHNHPVNPLLSPSDLPSKPDPYHNQPRPVELPPQLPQVSKEWLPLPENLFRHSVYLSPSQLLPPRPSNPNQQEQQQQQQQQQQLPSPIHPRRWSGLIITSPPSHSPPHPPHLSFNSPDRTSPHPSDHLQNLDSSTPSSSATSPCPNPTLTHSIDSTSLRPPQFSPPGSSSRARLSWNSNSFNTWLSPRQSSPRSPSTSHHSHHSHHPPTLLSPSPIPIIRTVSISNSNNHQPKAPTRPLQRPKSLTIDTNRHLQLVDRIDGDHDDLDRAAQVEDDEDRSDTRRLELSSNQQDHLDRSKLIRHEDYRPNSLLPIPTDHNQSSSSDHSRNNNTSNQSSTDHSPSLEIPPRSRSSRSFYGLARLSVAHPTAKLEAGQIVFQDPFHEEDFSDSSSLIPGISTSSLSIGSNHEGEGEVAREIEQTSPISLAETGHSSSIRPSAHSDHVFSRPSPPPSPLQSQQFLTLNPPHRSPPASLNSTTEDIRAPSCPLPSFSFGSIALLDLSTSPATANPSVAQSGPQHTCNRPGDHPPQLIAMPILTHPIIPSLPFRRRRASTLAQHLSNDSGSVSSSVHVEPNLPAVSTLLDSSHSKSLSFSHPNSSPDLYQSPIEHSTSSRILRHFRYSATPCDKLGGKMSKVKLLSTTTTTHHLSTAGLVLSGPSNSASCRDISPDPSINPSRRLPHALQITLPWETECSKHGVGMHHDNPRCLSPNSETSHPVMHPPFSSSIINPTIDPPSRLTSASQIGSNKLDYSNSQPVSPPPELNLSFSLDSSSQLTGIPYCDAGLCSPLPTILAQKTADMISTAACSSSEMVSSRASATHDRSDVPVTIYTRSQPQPTIPPPSRQMSNGRLPFSSRANIIIKGSITNDSAQASISSTSVDRSSTVPDRFRNLPRLDSYLISPHHTKHTSESSQSSQDECAIENGIEGDDQDKLDESDSISDQDDQDSSRHPADQTLIPCPATPFADKLNLRDSKAEQGVRSSWDELVTLGKPQACLLESNSSFLNDIFPSTPRQTTSGGSVDHHHGHDIRPSLSITPIAPSIPGDRARCLLLSTSSSLPKVPSPLPTRPSLDSRRSHSAFQLSPSSISSQSMQGNSRPSKDSSSPIEVIIPSVIVDPANDTFSSPRLGLSLAEPVSASPNPLLSSSIGHVAQRHQSMFELRPSTNLPLYDDLSSSYSGIKSTISPREEEGCEPLPAYNCAVHLEGWMPRKMEFKSPGVQAKDRAWKRQYIVLHGTMIRIYRSNPHTNPVSGSEDPYSSHFVHHQSSSRLASTCGMVPKSNSPRAPPLHFHQGQYDPAPVTSFKEAALVKATHLPTHHNVLQRVYTLQNAESGLAADYIKKKYIVRVRAEGEQFLLQAKDDRGVIDLIEALQAATNVSLDLDLRPLPKFITLPRRRRRRRVAPGHPNRHSSHRSSLGMGGREIGAAIVDSMVAEAAATDRHRRHESSWIDEGSDRMAEMLAEEQEAYLQGRS